MRTRLRVALTLAGALSVALAACSERPTEPKLPTEVAATPSAELSVAPSSQAVPDQYIVTLDAGVDPAAASAALSSRFGGAVLHVYRYALNGFAVRLPTAQAAQGLARSPGVLRVEPDLQVRAVAQTLPAGVDRIDADQNATSKIDGVNDPMPVDVAIIDTGIDFGQPELNAVAGTNCITPGALPQDDNGHGTHVSGTVAAIDNSAGVVGVAPGATVYAVKVLDSTGSGAISSVVCGIDWVTANASTISVANMSLGAQGTSASLHTALQNSVAAGVFYAVAAGNDAKDVYGPDQTYGTGDDFIPAAYPEVATVSAMADFDGSAGGNGGRLIFTGCGPIKDDTFAGCFSNYSSNVVAGNPVSSPGAAIDLAAPGVEVLSTLLGGGTGTMSGTSMATPHVTGAAAVEIVARGTRDWNGDGQVNAADVALMRQALIDAGQPQSAWRSGGTGDPDGNPEPLVYLGQSSSPPPPPPPPSGSVSVTSITPSSVTAGSAVDVTVSGSGFQAGASLSLENGSGPAPSVTNVVVQGSTSLTAHISTKSGGPHRSRTWDVRVTNPDGSTGVLSGGFTVQP